MADYWKNFMNSMIKSSDDAYEVLGLSKDASPEQARKEFFSLAKKYHPDLTNAGFSPDPDKIQKLYNRKDLELAGVLTSMDSFIESISSTNLDEKLNASSILWRMSNNKMTSIISAYKKIKEGKPDVQWENLFGYDIIRYSHTDEDGFDSSITLEGDGEIKIRPNHFEYHPAGPYLLFGKCDEPQYWMLWGFEINLRDIFAHLELKKNKKINQILLEPFFECFGFREKESDKIMDMILAGKKTKTIMNNLKIKDAKYLDFDSDEFNYSLSLWHELNRITNLSKDFSITQGDTLKIEEMEYGLADVEFSEADYNLFLTLTYGPMLSSR